MSTQRLLVYFVRITYYIALVALLSNLILQQTRFYYYRPFFVPFSIRLNHQSVVLPVGDTVKLSVFGINKRVSYSSTDFKVAYVLFNGKVFAIRVGKAVINANVDGEKVQCLITVVDINKEKLSLRLKETYKLKIEGTNSTVSWSSTDTSVVKVDERGNVIAVGTGSATVTGKVEGAKLSCRIKVSK